MIEQIINWFNSLDSVCQFTVGIFIFASIVIMFMEFTLPSSKGKRKTTT